MTSQGSAYGRLRRALDTGNAAIAFAFAKLALQQTSTGRSFGIVGGSAICEPHVSQVSSRRITRSPSRLAA